MDTLENNWLNHNALQTLSNNKLLMALEKNQIDKNGVKLVLAQHSHYSKNFTKYLCALICQIKQQDDLEHLLENLQEEMGFESSEKITHADLYQHSLQLIGVDPQDYPAFEETLELKQAMIEHCYNEDILEGLAALCLGAEAIVPILYTPIYHALQHHGYSAEATEFFRLHIQEDEDHAQVMIDIMARLIGDDQEKRRKVEKIGEKLITLRGYMFDRIYDEIQNKNQRYKNKATFYSSRDFGQVPNELKPYIPSRLKHAKVITSKIDEFSKERKHRVNVVDLPSRTISMTIGHLQHDEATRLHRHNYETMIYFIEGEGYSVIADERVSWQAGDAIYVPIWAPHQHVNTGEGTCTYVACENAPLLQNLGDIALREELS